LRAAGRRRLPPVGGIGRIDMYGAVEKKIVPDQYISGILEMASNLAKPKHRRHPSASKGRSSMRHTPHINPFESIRSMI
jgi:hypothetical protein